MKVALFLTVFSSFYYQSAFAKSTTTPMKHSQCFSDEKPIIESHCVCYNVRGPCGNKPVGTCARQLCERRTCDNDKDCNSIGAKCVENYCKKLNQQFSL